MQWIKNNFKISTDKSLLQVDRIHNFLANESYWAPQIPKNIVETAIENSECYGVYDTKTNKQVGFARLVTDYATFAWLSDVYVESGYRGHGISKWLVGIIMEQPEMKILRRICLTTKDAHKLYEKYGFEITKTPTFWMEIKDNDIYKKMQK